MFFSLVNLALGHHLINASSGRWSKSRRRIASMISRIVKSVKINVQEIRVRSYYLNKNTSQEILGDVSHLHSNYSGNDSFVFAPYHQEEVQVICHSNTPSDKGRKYPSTKFTRTVLTLSKNIKKYIFSRAMWIITPERRLPKKRLDPILNLKQISKHYWILCQDERHLEPVIESFYRQIVKS